jgi:uncharacterized protein (DUF362 family)
MTKQTRRELMARSAALAGTLAVGRGADAAAAGASKMAIAKWAGDAKPSADAIKQIAVKLTEQAIAGIGGLKPFVKPGSVVFVKPNIGWDRKPEQAGNTNPEVVATIVKHCLAAGAKTVRVGDNTVNSDRKTYATSGIAAAAKSAGAEIVFVDRKRFRDTDIGGRKIKSIPIYPAFLECDLMINVPVVKHHRLSTVTLCMKNYMGVVENRRAFHQDIATCLCDITRFMKPRITLLDAVRILTDHGPSGGKLEDVKTTLQVAAATDIVALDAWGSSLLGHKPSAIGSVAAGAKSGLGTMDFKSIAREIPVS